MPNWTEDDYVKRAAVIAQQSVSSKKTLNDCCEKAAQDDSLNPEEIRTLVRLSNVAMFQHQFREKDQQGHSDRHVEFEVGDPEAVIQRLHQAAATPPQSANIMNDKLAHEVPDMMAAKRRGFELDNGTVKVATDLEIRPARKDIVITTMRKLAEEFDIRRQSADFRWNTEMAKLAAAFNKAPGYGPNFREFEKDAFSEFGEEAVIEMAVLRDALKIAFDHTTPDERKKLAEYHVAADSKELGILKTALAARADFKACEEAEAWVKKHTPTEA